MLGLGKVLQETCGLGLALDLTAHLQFWTLSAVLICSRMPYFLAYVPSATLLLICLRFHWCYRQLLQEQFFSHKRLAAWASGLDSTVCSSGPPLSAVLICNRMPSFSRICAFRNTASRLSALSLVLQTTFTAAVFSYKRLAAWASGLDNTVCSSGPPSLQFLFATTCRLFSYMCFLQHCFSSICAFAGATDNFYIRRFYVCSMVPFDLAGGCCTCFSLEFFSHIHFCVTFPW